MAAGRTARKICRSSSFDSLVRTSENSGPRVGNAAREEIHLPGMNNVDFSAVKNFRIRERNNFQFRAEFFNFFNHVNLGAPGLNLQAPNTFGVITTSVQGAAGVPNDGRVIQFALKYQF